MPNYWHQVNFWVIFTNLGDNGVMWRACGIEIERTRARNFFCRQTRKLMKMKMKKILFGMLLGNEESCWMGHKR